MTCHRNVRPMGVCLCCSLYICNLSNEAIVNCIDWRLMLNVELNSCHIKAGIEMAANSGRRKRVKHICSQRRGKLTADIRARKYILPLSLMQSDEQSAPVAVTQMLLHICTMWLQILHCLLFVWHYEYKYPLIYANVWMWGKTNIAVILSVNIFSINNVVCVGLQQKLQKSHLWMEKNHRYSRDKEE